MLSLFAQDNQGFNIKNIGIKSTNVVHMLAELLHIPSSKSIPTYTIKSNLYSSYAYIFINLLIIITNSAIFMFILKKIYQKIDQKSSINIVIFIASVSVILILTQMKNALYVNDDNTCLKEYYSHLLLIYQLLINIPTEIYQQNYTYINTYYKSMYTFLYKYIYQLKYINQNGLLFNILQILLIVIILLWIYDANYIIISLSAGKIYNAEIHDFTYKDQPYKFTKDKDNNTPMLNDDTIDQLYKFYNPSLDLTEQKNIAHAFLEKNSQLNMLEKSSRHNLEIYSIILRITLLSYNDRLSKIDQLSAVINQVLTFTYFTSDKWLLLIIVILFIIMLLIIPLYQSATKKQDNLEIEFDIITANIINQWNTYVLYGLNTYYEQRQMDLSKKILISENFNIYFRILLYVIIIIIILCILLLILNRYTILVLFQHIIVNIRKIFAIDIYMIFLILLFTTFMVSLKIYIMNMFKTILDIIILECDNSKKGVLIDFVFTYLQKLSVNNSDKQTSNINKFTGNIFFKNVTYNSTSYITPSLTFNIRKNTITIIYTASNINIFDYFNEIKRQNHNIFIEIGDNVVNLSILKNKEIYDIFIFNDEFPIILMKSLEKNIWPFENMNLFNIKLLHQIIPLEKLFTNMNAVDNNNEYACFNASGGEKQRICIARSITHLLKNNQNKCLIFNKSFSGIDKKTTNYILQQLLLTKKENNIVIISDDLDNIQYADDIIYIDKNGKATVFTDKIDAIHQLQQLLQAH